MENWKGLIQRRILVAIIAGVLVLIGIRQYQAGKNRKEQAQELVAKQGEAPNVFTGIANPGEKNDTQGNTGGVSNQQIKYTSEETDLYEYTVDESGMVNLKLIKKLSRGTQVEFISEIVQKPGTITMVSAYPVEPLYFKSSRNTGLSKVSADGQEGWVWSEKLVDVEPPTPNLSAIIKHWRPVVAYVECDFRDLNTHELYSQVRGSGWVKDLSGLFTVITNKHVIVDKDNYQPFSCRIQLPGHSYTYTGQKFSAEKKIDVGYIDIDNPDEYIKNITDINGPISGDYCRIKPLLGDTVLILGYPSIGSPTDITATEGIISGFDGDYFITSAKVEHGNSGGVAILAKDDCYLGIPSFAETGSIESLSRILDVRAFIPSL